MHGDGAVYRCICCLPIRRECREHTRHSLSVRTSQFLLLDSRVDSPGFLVFEIFFQVPLPIGLGWDVVLY